MKKLFAIFIAVVLFFGCVSNPYSGKKTMAFIGNSQLFPSSFSQYNDFLNESTVVTGTADAVMVTRVGSRLANAAKLWLESEGNYGYLDDYQWEYKLVQDDIVNAWCMPGGKIVVYTGILPITQTEEGLAVVLGHEVAHALLNHGQQRMSAGLLQQLGAMGIALGTSGFSPEIQSLAMTAYGIGSELGGTLPFSRSHESEADHYGLILMAIAGYNPEASVPFWERMAAGGGGGVPQFLSTHPSESTRIKQLTGWIPEAMQRAAEFNVKF